MKNKTSYIVEYINKHIKDQNNQQIINLLNQYLTSSYTFKESNYSWQPGFKTSEVITYRVYPDTEMAYKHKTNRLLVVFLDNTEIDISLYKFKKYAKNHMKYITQ
jgi:hypothetical protein